MIKAPLMHLAAVEPQARYITFNKGEIYIPEAVSYTHLDVYKRQEQDGYAPGESIAFDFENGSGTYTYQGKIAGSFVSAGTYLVIPEGVYRSMNPRGTAYGYLWVDCDKKDISDRQTSLFADRGKRGDLSAYADDQRQGETDRDS